MTYFEQIILVFSMIFLFSCAEHTTQKSDPLASWKDGQSKQSILDFVDEVTNETSPNFVKPQDRIATFDNDGTLWSEQPYYFQLQFALDRVKVMSADHPEWKDNPLFQAVLNNDIKKVFHLVNMVYWNWSWRLMPA